MVVYNQTSTSKKYVGGFLIGIMVLPAILLIAKGLIHYGIALLIIYLIIETSKTGCDFNFEKAKITRFKEALFIFKIPLKLNSKLNTFSHYRVKRGSDLVTMSANWAQHSTVSEEHYVLELLNRNKGVFEEVIKSDFDQIQSLVIKLEEKGLIAKN